MKKFFAKTAALTCLLAPLVASAATTSIAPAAAAYSDSLTFSIASGFTGDVTVGYNWSDFGLSKISGGSTYSIYNQASSLGYSLNGSSLVNVADAANVNTGGKLQTSGMFSGSYKGGSWSGVSGVGSISFNDLAAGTYTLTFTGSWDPITVVQHNNGFKATDRVAPVVNLAEAGLGGAANIKLTAIPAIPEPESYAMLLAGLGIMAVVARRRKTGG